ncbi:MAG: hypothetical protein HYW80_00975 [Parcubacteria group bacterium]|nr:hypothetical protein [Parcubacteria group bacterium]
MHIGGVQRCGKSEVARRLKTMLEEQGLKAVILDVDETRIGIFGPDKPDAPLGSPANKQRQKAAYDAVFNLRIPDVLEAGGTPIFTATHAAGAPLKFILIDPPSFEEAARRSLNDTMSLSDMKDMSSDTAQRENFEQTLARLREAYDDLQEPHLKLPQGSPEEMAKRALEFILAPEA